MKNTTTMIRSVMGIGLLWACSCLGDADITLSGPYTTDVDKSCRTDTKIILNGAVFTNCSLKLRSANEASPITYTIELVDGTQNVFQMIDDDKECIKATKKTNLVITGTGSLELLSEKRITDSGMRSGVLVCNNLTVAGGDTTVTFDTAKNDTSCIFLKGNYLQTGGKVKVDMKKKNSTNEFHGVTFDSKSTTFRLEGGKFNAEIAGTRSRAIDLKGSCTATFTAGEVKAEFEGPEGRFVSGGKVVFNGGSYTFTTNITSKMTAAYYPTALNAVKAESSITINGGDFEADLPLEGSEIFSNDSVAGTDITIAGGTFDLVAGDDCVSANGDIFVRGGTFYGVSVFDDVLDANANMTISGGNLRAYATAPLAHGLDVNKKKKLTISGGVVVATDGVGAERIDSGSTEVGKTAFSQFTYYGTLPIADYSGKYLLLEGVTNNVAFTVKPRLPTFPAGTDFNLLVSIPGRVASVPMPKSVADAYADANSRTPLVFEKKAKVKGHTIVTKEGDELEIPAYYDVAPADGKTKTVTLALNALAAPEYADLATDGIETISCLANVVNVGVRTHAGLKYQLVSATDLATPSPWPAVGAVADGDGKAKALVAPRAGNKAFFKVRVSD